MDTIRQDLEGLLIRDIRWSVKTAGPSPDNNERTELFLLGCKKAMCGNACEGCFNTSTWDASEAEFSHDVKAVAAQINEFAPNKYVTIGGGEPTDQIENLIELCKELKKYNFHIIVYTWRTLDFKGQKFPISIFGYSDPKDYFIANKLKELYDHVDIVIDGEYIQMEHRWDGINYSDGFISSVGSANQKIWDMSNGIGYEMGDIKALKLSEQNELIYMLKDSAVKYKLTRKEDKAICIQNLIS